MLFELLNFLLCKKCAVLALNKQALLTSLRHPVTFRHNQTLSHASQAKLIRACRKVMHHVLLFNKDRFSDTRALLSGLLNFNKECTACTCTHTKRTTAIPSHIALSVINHITSIET